MTIHARKRFGQHFLEPAWVEKLIRVIDPRANETFLEIGAGRGALTRPLAASSHHVHAFEIDHELIAELRAAQLGRVTVVEGDFLRVSNETIRQTMAGECPGALRVAGNLPYNVASPILFRLVELFAAGIAIVDATVMLQREVAARLTALPGTRDYGVLAILIGHTAEIERLLVLPPGAFRPPPKVTSAVVRLRFHPPIPPAKAPTVLTALVHAIFTRRRKTLANALKAFSPSKALVPARALMLAGLDGRRRPETLTIPELVRLADIYAEQAGNLLAEKGEAVL
jgi:16S rRNA (adenine1518-N6/adenine1519-N6)-dimethyltransferase